MWKHHFDTTFSPPPGVSFGTLCPGGQLATPVIGPGKTPGSYIIYAAAWDGRLHQLDVATGKAVAPSELFMPPNGKPYGLNLWNNVIYTTSAQGCGGNPNYVYAFDLATRRTATFDPGSGGMWGRSGPSIGKDGTVYTGTGDGSYNPELRSYGTAIIGVKIDPKTGALKLKDYFGPPNAEYLLKRDIDLQVTGPVFDHAGREWLVQGSKECRTWLLDTSALGGEDHSTAEHRSPLICNEDQDYQAAGVYGAMATYEDAKGTRWVLVPFWGPKHPKFKAPIEHGEVFNGAVAAFRMEKNRDGTVRAESRVDFARHEARRPAGHRERHRVWLRERRRRRAAIAAHAVWRSAGQRRHAGPHRALHPRGVIRARRGDGAGAVVERRHDHVVESLQRHFGRERPRVHRHL